MSYSDLGTLAAVVFITGEIVLRIAALGIIPRNRKPTAGMAWLLVILFDPWIGFFFFLFFGSARVGGKRRAKQAEINLLIAERTASIADPAVDASPLVTTFLHLNRKLGALPPATAATRRALPRLPRLDGRDDRGDRDRADPRPRRVLHLRPRRHDAGVLPRPSPTRRPAE